MTSPDGAGLPDKEDVGGWAGGSTGPLAILEQFGQYLIMRPLDRLLSGLLGTEPGSFDTVEELVQDLIPAIIRKVLGGLGDLLGGGSSGAGSSVDVDLLDKIPLLADVAKAIRGITTGLTGDLLSGAESIKDLQDKTQELEGVIGYHATYMPEGSGTYPVGSWKWLGFTSTVGPHVGTVVSPDGGITLLSKGLWRADVQVYFSYEMVLGQVEVEIVVFDEYGAVYGKRSLKVLTSTGSASYYTAVTNYTFVVPRSGFRVRVRARTDGLAREILTGLQYTSFTVNKWSDETE
ncbi:hypothetical protein PBI_MAHDIA_25 [Gordonia phage Mahdia]|uniref:Minor tail protein n=1 Tax=Gordonia phage Mahdia TaxID=2047873 RepID=A0A2H4P9X9_9CAUD|nr:hypothetical protein FDJ14_gp25 [Gordonia phage Mahdia]ATW59024.1 hypothetical protein PBI_MAHDIA_25 [Gordonia phage Mahdia]